MSIFKSYYFIYTHKVISHILLKKLNTKIKTTCKYSQIKKRLKVSNGENEAIHYNFKTNNTKLVQRKANMLFERL